MPLHLYWFLPSHGDGREVGKTATDQGRARTIRRAPDIGYLAQVAQAADTLGFTGMLVPTGLFCEDPWVVSAALAARTRRVKFMIALRSGLTSPLLTAQMAATFQRVSGDRLVFNIVAGGDADEQRRYGDWLAHDDRYARTAEFLTVLRGLWQGGPVDFDGDHYRLKAGLLTRPATMPQIHLGGSSAAARRVAAEHADVYLAWGEPPPQLGELMTDFRRQSDATGRDVRLGTRFHVISRDTAEEAWETANRLIEGMDPALIAQAQERFRRTESEGQRRASALHGGRTDDLEIYPNVWAGYGLVRPGAGIALVGSHEEVADRIAEYHKSGIDHLILSGQPHLEEAYWFGEGVMPLLRARGLLEETSAGS
ncbi:LLM class flavin-dependent oxidoreductase [Nonomuraea muscovyensis]